MAPSGPRSTRPLRASGVLGLALLFAVLIVSRKPAALLHAELWGDEGWSFYPDAYRVGWQSLLIPAGGYLDTLQRLVGIAVQPLPLTAVPTVFAAVALGVQLLPALFLLSHRMAAVLPSAPVRLLLALLYAVLPNELEFYVNLTNAQWNLALLAFLILVGAPPHGPAGRLLDIVVLVLSGLSGPFMLLLLPVSVWQLAARRHPDDRRHLLIVAATALIQLGVLVLVSHGGRSAAPLGAGPRMLARVLSLQVILGAELGLRTLGRITVLRIWQDNLLPVLLTVSGAVLAALALWRGSSLLRQFVLFCALLLAAALVSPQVSLTQPQWLMMTIPPLGNRYFSFPVMAWIAIVTTLAADRARPLRLVGRALLGVIVLWAVPHDWAVLRMQPTDFLARARAFEAAPPGTRMSFPIVPNGLSPMILVKKPG